MRKLIFIALLGAGFMPAQAMFPPIALSLSVLASQKVIEVGGSAVQRGVNSAWQSVLAARGCVEGSYKKDVLKKCRLLERAGFSRKTIDSYLAPFVISSTPSHRALFAETVLEYYGERFFKNVDEDALKDVVLKFGFGYATQEGILKYVRLWVDSIESEEDNKNKLKSYIGCRKFLNGIHLRKDLFFQLFIQKDVQQQLDRIGLSLLKIFLPRMVNCKSLASILCGLRSSHEKKEAIRFWVDTIKGSRELFDWFEEKCIDPYVDLFSYVSSVISSDFFPASDMNQLFVESIEEVWKDMPQGQIEALKERCFNTFPLLAHAILAAGKPEDDGRAPMENAAFILNNMPSIEYFYEGDCLSEKRRDKIVALVERVIHFSHEEYQKNKIVLYRGQNLYYQFFERLYNSLKALIFKSPMPNDFVRFRFKESEHATDAQVTEICRDGLKVEHFEEYLPKIASVNLHILANIRGSNSLVYILGNNYIEKVGKGRHYNKEIFDDFGLSGEWQNFEKEITDLFKLYAQMAKDSGDMGRLICFGLSKDLARGLVFPVGPGYTLAPCGVRKPITINGQPTTDVVEIAENYDQVPFNNEYALILSKEICDPVEAQKAGVVMKAFDGLDRESESYKAFEAEFDRVMALIEAAYRERVGTRPAAAV